MSVGMKNILYIVLHKMPVSIGTINTLQVVNRYKGANYPIMNLHERVLSVLTNRVIFTLYIYIYTSYIMVI